MNFVVGYKVGYFFTSLMNISFLEWILFHGVRMLASIAIIGFDWCAARRINLLKQRSDDYS